MSEYKINRDSIKHLLETPPCVGVDITETPMSLVENAMKTFNERKHEYIMECIVKADIDPDALIKTAKKNQELMEELAELYKKIEDGTLVEMPCKVGQTFYYIDKYSNSVETDTAVFFTVTKDGCKAILRRHNKRFWEDQEWGKTVFLTREEAEKALERGDTK